MAVRFTPGSMFRVDVPGGRSAWAVMLAKFPHVAFYADEPPAAEPLFILAVQRNAFTGGGWGSRSPGWTPRMCRRSPTSSGRTTTTPVNA